MLAQLPLRSGHEGAGVCQALHHKMSPPWETPSEHQKELSRAAPACLLAVDTSALECVKDRIVAEKSRAKLLQKQVLICRLLLACPQWT